MLASLHKATGADQNLPTASTQETSWAVRQVTSGSSLRNERGRSRAKKLAIFKKDKSIRQQQLNDRDLSWSYDWREPLKDLEKCSVAGLGKYIAPSRVPLRISIPHNIRADKIARPTIWTDTSFNRYVHQLVYSTVDRLVAKGLYLGKESHLDAVADALDDVFSDPELRYMFNGKSASKALNFFFENGKFARGRRLFGRLQELQRGTHPSTFNIMLKAASEHKDLFTFTYILKLMIRHNVRPNVSAWLHLARAVQNDEVRQTIIDRMKRKGFLEDPVVSHEAVALMIPQLAGKHLDSGADPHRLLDFLDEQFGPGWCHGKASGRIIEEVGVRQSTHKALTILHRLRARGYQPNHGLLLLLLRQCSWTRDHELVISILHEFRTAYDLLPSNSQICDVLFKQAWKSHLYNCCKVIWIYACVHGCTSYDMQRTVMKSMCAERSEPLAKKSRSVTWEEGAGQVVTSRVGRISQPRLNRLLFMWQPAEPGRSRNARDKFLRVMRRILSRDLGAVGKSRINKPLDGLLSEALQMDRQWAANRALQTTPLECKYTQSIDVKLEPKYTLGFSNRAVTTQENQTATADQREAGCFIAAEDPDTNSPTTTEGPDLESSGCCWMSSAMRFRPCTCPDYIKKKPSDLQSSDDAEDIQEQAEEAEKVALPLGP
ncbi:MAG: hypothetical protein Q9218_001318 [Villophora microphyllina]